MPARAKTVASKPADIQDKLLEALGEVDRPGDVCTSGDCPLVMPGLEVEGLGGVGLPLTKTQAKKLIKRCRQAPYGKGTETVVDTDVRRVWELDPAQFKLTNPKWDEFVTSIVENVKQALGLGGRTLAAHLYKLLVYHDPGLWDAWEVPEHGGPWGGDVAGGRNSLDLLEASFFPV